jgi:hypothetical protein
VIRSRCVLPVLALLALAAPGRADPVEDLTRLVREASATPNPAMAFLRGAGGMGDFKLAQADIKRALEAAGVPQTGLLRQLLGPTTRLVKQGNQVWIDRAKPTVIVMPNGSAVQLDRQVHAQLTVQGPQDATISEIHGMKVGEDASQLYDLQKVRFTREGGRPVAKVTAGAFIFSKTVTIDLTPKPGAAPFGAGSVTASAPNGKPTPTVGLVGALGAPGP